MSSRARRQRLRCEPLTELNRLITAMKTLRALGAALALIAATTAFAQAPSVIRIGVATGGVGTPPRTGSSTVGLVNSQGLLEKEFAKDNIKVEWIFFKGAGPAVNEALVNHQLDFAWQGDLPSIVHRAASTSRKGQSAVTLTTSSM